MWPTTGSASRSSTARAGGVTYANVAAWNQSGLGAFVNLSGVAVDPSGNVFVVDQSTSRVTELSAAGTPTFWWGTIGNGDSSFTTPYDIAVSPGGAVYVADAGLSAPSSVNHRVMRYARDATAPVTTATVTPFPHGPMQLR